MGLLKSTESRESRFGSSKNSLCVEFFSNCSWLQQRSHTCNWLGGVSTSRFVSLKQVKAFVFVYLVPWIVKALHRYLILLYFLGFIVHALCKLFMGIGPVGTTLVFVVAVSLLDLVPHLSLFFVFSGVVLFFRNNLEPKKWQCACELLRGDQCWDLPQSECRAGNWTNRIEY